MVTIFILIALSVIISEIAMTHHELRRRLSFAPAHVVHLRQPYRFFTWTFLHISRTHLYTNTSFLLALAVFGHFTNHQAGLMAFSASLLSPIPRMFFQKDDWLFKATGISSTIAALIYYYALREQNPYLIGLVAANAIYEAVMAFLRPRGRIMYDSHLIGAGIGLFCFMIGI